MTYELEVASQEYQLEVADPTKISYSGNKGRILEMLGNGMGPEIVATACGVSPSYVSQLLADKEFSEAVIARRYNELQKHNARDAALDSLEDALIKKLQDLLPMMYKPGEILNAFSRINAAKRRGSAASQEANTIINNQVVNLIMPPSILQRFTRDANNQVIEVASSIADVPAKKVEEKQSLVTMPSSMLAGLNNARKKSGAQELENVQTIIPTASLTNTG